MALIEGTLAAELRQAFSALVAPVRLVAFSAAETQLEPELHQLLDEVVSLEPRLGLDVCSVGRDAARAAELRIERTPAIALVGARDHGVRFYGLPGGYEFGALVDGILDVSRGDSGLAPATRAALRALEHDVHIRVFSTPT